MKINTILLTAIILFISISAFSQLKVNSSGKVGIGIDPTSAFFFYKLQVLQATMEYIPAPLPVPLAMQHMGYLALLPIVLVVQSIVGFMARYTVPLLPKADRLLVLQE